MSIFNILFFFKNKIERFKKHAKSKWHYDFIEKMKKKS